jgi:mRNA-degrading endonuclease HigB of HigAB toxin-antitoxin module
MVVARDRSGGNRPIYRASAIRGNREMSEGHHKWGATDSTRTRVNIHCVINARPALNIKGNDFRLVVALQYRAGVLAIRFFGAHREYDAIDAEPV